MKHKHFLTLQRSPYPLDAIATKKALLDMGLRMSDLADALGVSHSTISLIVRGKTRNLRIQEAIAHMLQVSLSALWARDSHKPKRVRVVRSSSSPNRRGSSPAPVAPPTPRKGVLS